MTPIIIDQDAVSERKAASGFPALLPQEKLPDLHQEPRRRLHPVVIGMLGFAAASGFFYGSEALAPAAFKPSTIIGGYGHEIAKAHKSGELEAQVRYDAQLRGIEVQYQGQLKQIETAANQWQENYRSQLTLQVEGYRAAYARANIFAQATADLQKQYAAARQQIATMSSGGDVQIANLSDVVAGFADFLDPEFAKSARAYGDEARARTYRRLDGATQGGLTVAVDGWNIGLPDPDEFARRVQNLPPLQLPAGSRAIAVPAPAPLTK